MNNPEDRIENHVLLKDLVWKIEYVLASEIETFIAGNLGRGPDKSHCRRCKIISDQLFEDIQSNTRSAVYLRLMNTVISRDYLTFLNQTPQFNSQRFASFLEQRLKSFIENGDIDLKISPRLFDICATKRRRPNVVLQNEFVEKT